MGLRAIVYFEVVTTIALFIGLGAINISRAGVGVQQPAMQLEEVKTVKQSAADVVLQNLSDMSEFIDKAGNAGVRGPDHRTPIFNATKDRVGNMLVRTRRM